MSVKGRRAKIYRGVLTRDGGLSWAGRIKIAGREVLLGTYARQRDAALAYDRVARFLGAGPERWNFPDLELEAASVDVVRAEARRLALARSERHRKGQHVSWKIKPRGDTGYWGVAPRADGRFRGYLYISASPASVGLWPTAKAAAIARDRAVLHLGLGWPLNEPRASQAAGPLAPLALRSLAPRVRADGQRTGDRVGVSYDRRAKKWAAHLKTGGVTHFLGRYERLEDAADAHDRAASALVGKHARTNAPGVVAQPATPAALRQEAHRLSKATLTSRYDGVSFAPGLVQKPWCAKLVQQGLGFWETEREAALAVDRASLHLGLERVLNLPRRARELGPASPAALRAEAYAQFKATTSSRYRGVYWSKGGACWIAQIGHRRKVRVLGRFTSDEAAARAYDEAARRLHGLDARLNFPSE